MESDVLKKLRIKSGHRAAILDAPASYRELLAGAPEGVELAESLDGQFDFIHCFVTRKADLERMAPELRAAMRPESILWVSYPKGQAIPTDLKRDIAWQVLADAGLKAVAQVAMDEVWTAMRFKLG